MRPASLESQICKTVLKCGWEGTRLWTLSCGMRSKRVVMWTPPFLGQIIMPGLTEINWLLLFMEMKAFGWVNHVLINNFCTFGQHRQQTLSIFVRCFEKCAKRNICMLISKLKDNFFFAPGKNSPGSTHSYHSSILYFLIQFIYEIPVRFNMKFP